LPGAVNLPLLDDAARHQVGLVFKAAGRRAAIEKGFELAGGGLGTLIAEASRHCPEMQAGVYCWRGGLRSAIVGWLLSLSGIRVTVLKGGYKAFRRWALAQFDEPKRVLVIGGKTGSGKTRLLHALRNAGEQVIDLEALACHKGSAFGSLGQPPQPRNEQFENELAMAWSAADAGRTLWLENESRLIGHCLLPEGIYRQMRAAPVAEITLAPALRLQRVLREYGGFPAAALMEKTGTLRKRLGGLLHDQAMTALSENRLEEWASLLLGYYDRTYEHSNRQRDPSLIRHIPLAGEAQLQHAGAFLSAVEQAFRLRPSNPDRQAVLRNAG
jgi:tRNA 2-selenouridine synthase